MDRFDQKTGELTLAARSLIKGRTRFVDVARFSSSVAVGTEIIKVKGKETKTKNPVQRTPSPPPSAALNNPFDVIESGSYVMAGEEESKTKEPQKKGTRKMKKMMKKMLKMGRTPPPHQRWRRGKTPKKEPVGMQPDWSADDLSDIPSVSAWPDTTTVAGLATVFFCCCRCFVVVWGSSSPFIRRRFGRRVFVCLFFMSADSLTCRAVSLPLTSRRSSTVLEKDTAAAAAAAAAILLSRDS